MPGHCGGRTGRGRNWSPRPQRPRRTPQSLKPALATISGTGQNGTRACGRGTHRRGVERWAGAAGILTCHRRQPPDGVRRARRSRRPCLESPTLNCTEREPRHGRLGPGLNGLRNISLHSSSTTAPSAPRPHGLSSARGTGGRSPGWHSGRVRAEQPRQQPPHWSATGSAAASNSRYGVGPGPVSAASGGPLGRATAATSALRRAGGGFQLMDRIPRRWRQHQRRQARKLASSSKRHWSLAR